MHTPRRSVTVSDNVIWSTTTLQSHATSDSVVVSISKHCLPDCDPFVDHILVETINLAGSHGSLGDFDEEEVIRKRAQVFGEECAKLENHGKEEGTLEKVLFCETKGLGIVDWLAPSAGREVIRGTGRVLRIGVGGGASLCLGAAAVASALPLTNLDTTLESSADHASKEHLSGKTASCGS